MEGLINISGWGYFFVSGEMEEETEGSCGGDGGGSGSGSGDGDGNEDCTGEG